MSAIDEYWQRSAPALEAQFSRSRGAHTDSAVKGSANELVLAEFLQQNTGARRVATNSTVIDAWGARSGEVDVAVLNDNQPLWTGSSGQLLIAEGVDAVYQVKAQLNTTELRRAIANARTVKRLFRPLGAGSTARATDIDGTRFIDRVPFFIFAYEASVSSASTLRQLADELKDDPWEMQPDGIFVLRSWTLVNVANNEGKLKVAPIEVHGFREVETASSLSAMMWCHHLFIHRTVDFAHPLERYPPFATLNAGRR
jgi:hypothetical protein